MFIFIRFSVAAHINACLQSIFLSETKKIYQTFDHGRSGLGCGFKGIRLIHKQLVLIRQKIHSSSIPLDDPQVLYTASGCIFSV